MESHEKVNTWINQNLESLFESYKKNPTKGFVYKPTKLDYIEERQKKEFKEFLMDNAERMITKRRKKLHQSHIREIKS